MKQTLKNWFAALLLAVPMSVAVASGGGHYEKVDIDLRDQVSLQRGAQIFTNYCLSLPLGKRYALQPSERHRFD